MALHSLKAPVPLIENHMQYLTGRGKLVAH